MREYKQVVFLGDDRHDIVDRFYCHDIVDKRSLTIE
jgi:hypothetical protein